MEPSVPTRRRRIGILLICSLSLFIVGLDITVVNVALPSIGRELGAGISGLQWTVDAYTVVLASLLMFSGSMGDRLGRKGVFIAGLGVFSAASVLCSLAPTVELLVAARVLQAGWACVLQPGGVLSCTKTFSGPRGTGPGGGGFGGPCWGAR